MTTLWHHLTVAALWQAYDRLKRTAAPGVDGVTWQDYGENLIPRLTELTSTPPEQPLPPMLGVNYFDRWATTILAGGSEAWWV
jgi:hypothetical protein